MPKAEDYLVGIDIGSSKVGVLIGQIDDTGNVEVVGKGLARNKGTRRGSIVNVEQTVEALRAASEEAEVMAGVEISRAYVGLGSSEIRSLNSRAMVTVSRDDREITREDIMRVMEAARSTAVPSDREILHAIPQEFVVDEQGGIEDPMGMLGTRLESLVHLVVGNIARTKTLATCVNRSGIEVIETVFEPLAAAEAVLTDDEKDLGVLLLDIGEGGSEYSMYTSGEVYHSAVLPIGASHFTNDLAMVLRTPFAEAERLKVRYGCCIQSMVDAESGITVPSVAGGSEQVVPSREVCEILQPRAEELLTLVRDDLVRSGWDDCIRSGVVLTGGGAKLDGLLELAEHVFGTRVRFGVPQGLGGLADVISAPTWSTAAGLLIYGRDAERRRREQGQRKRFDMRNWFGTIREVFSDLL